MNHSLYIWYLFVSYKLNVRMQIKRIFELKSVDTNPEISLAGSSPEK